MYLAEFRREGVAPGCWTAKVHGAQMDRWFGELDSALRPVKEAKALFEYHQPRGEHRVTHAAHKAFHQVIKHLRPDLKTYPAYQLAYALLVSWVHARKVDDAMGCEEVTKKESHA